MNSQQWKRQVSADAGKETCTSAANAAMLKLRYGYPPAEWLLTTIPASFIKKLFLKSALGFLDERR